MKVCSSSMDSHGPERMNSQDRFSDLWDFRHSNELCLSEIQFGSFSLLLLKEDSNIFSSIFYKVRGITWNRFKNKCYKSNLQRLIEYILSLSLLILSSVSLRYLAANISVLSPFHLKTPDPFSIQDSHDFPRSSWCSRKPAAESLLSTAGDMMLITTTAKHSTSPHFGIIKEVKDNSSKKAVNHLS